MRRLTLILGFCSISYKESLVSNSHKYSFQETDEPAKANTSDLNEELGQVCNYGLLDYFNLVFLHFAIINKRLDKKNFILVMNKIFGAFLEKVYTEGVYI